MMKKILAILMALAMLLSFASAEEDLQKKALQLKDALLNGDYDSVVESLDENLAAMLNPTNLAGAIEPLAASLGEHQGTLSCEKQESDAGVLVDVTEGYSGGQLLLRFLFDGEGRLSGLNAQPKAAETAETGPWTEVELTVQADPAYPLGATLCLPEGVEKPPVVVLVQGSGSSDRDENVFQNHPFRDIAHDLAKKGIATLRYDKRTFVYPEVAGTGADIGLREEILDDVNACIALMAEDGRVDGERIYVLGHSLGGMLLPAIAAENPNLAGGISMAGSLRPLWEISYDQNMESAQRLRENGMGEAEEAVLNAQLEIVERDVNILRGDFSELADDETLLGVPVRYWKSLKEYAGMNFIDEIDLPLLILQGEADFQVSPEVDFPLWQEALAGRENVRLILYPELNHVMMPTQGYRDTNDYAIPSRVSPQVIEDIAAFING